MEFKAGVSLMANAVEAEEHGCSPARATPLDVDARGASLSLSKSCVETTGSCRHRVSSVAATSALGPGLWALLCTTLLKCQWLTIHGLRRPSLECLNVCGQIVGIGSNLECTDRGIEQLDRGVLNQSLVLTTVLEAKRCRTDHKKGSGIGVLGGTWDGASLASWGFPSYWQRQTVSATPK